MSKHKYLIWEETPLLFYKLLINFLWIPIVIGSFTTIGIISEWAKITGFYFNWIFWVEIIFRVSILLLAFFAEYWLQKRIWRGAVSFFLYLGITCLYQIFCDLILSFENAFIFIIVRFAVFFLIFLPCFVYFKKRRLLFFPYIDSLENVSNVENSDFSKKQKRRLNTIVIAVLVSLAILFSAYAGYKFGENKTICEKNEEIESIEETYKERINKINERYDKNYALLQEALEELDFWEEFAVIVTSEGEKYHRYSCQYVEGKSFWIYNVEAAISRGYDPCLVCDPPIRW